MSHHPGSESDQKDPKKSINEAIFLSGGGTVEAPNAVINVTAASYDKASFGPQTSTKHIEANTIEHVTITHNHHYAGADKSEAVFDKDGKDVTVAGGNFESSSTFGATEARPKQNLGEDWVSSITESLVPIWNGAVKDHVGEDMLPCRLYRSPSLQDVIEIDDSGWKFQMNPVSYLDIGSLKKVTDEEPSGYIVTSKDELEKLTDKLTRNDLMGWINISKDGKDSKAIVLLFQRDYPELFGFFLPDTKNLTSLIGNLASKQRSKLQVQKPVAGPVTQPFASESPSTSRSTRTRRKRKANEESPSISGSTRTRPKRTAKKGVGARADNQSATNEREQMSPGLIPWWIFTEGLQN